MIRIFEYIWLFMSLLGLSGIIYKVIKQEDRSQIGLFVVFTFIAVVMYLIRRRQRIAMDRTKTEETSDKYH
jgi:inner membrane protein involved in colicin E2 resistance